jgi:hypothetical protein
MWTSARAERKVRKDLSTTEEEESSEEPSPRALGLKSGPKDKGSQTRRKGSQTLCADHLEVRAKISRRFNEAKKWAPFSGNAVGRKSTSKVSAMER